MRPQSEIRVDLAAALVDGDGTCKQLAQRTGWSVSLTMRTLDNMVRAGDACKSGSVRMPGVKRPVPVYSKAMRDVDAIAASHANLAHVMGGWARWPSYVGGVTL